MNKNESIHTPANSTTGDVELLLCVSAPLTIFSFVFYAVVFCLGLFGNTLVIATIYRQSSLHTPFNYSVVNFAKADICVFLFSLPVVVFRPVAGVFQGGFVSICLTKNF